MKELINFLVKWALKHGFAFKIPKGNDEKKITIIKIDTKKLIVTVK